MVKFDVYLLPTSYVVDLQAELLGDIGVCVVAPLLPLNEMPARPMVRLNPVLRETGIGL